MHVLPALLVRRTAGTTCRLQTDVMRVDTQDGHHRYAMCTACQRVCQHEATLDMHAGCAWT